MHPVAAARAVAGMGLEGDRYWQANPARPKKVGPDREITLIEAEALEGLAADTGTPLEAAASRRNIVTRGVSLNSLVGREFRVGNVSLRGLRLCDPCSHLESLTHRSDLLEGLAERGGLRAQILSDGEIHTGDEIQF